MSFGISDQYGELIGANALPCFVFGYILFSIFAHL